MIIQRIDQRLGDNLRRRKTGWGPQVSVALSFLVAIAVCAVLLMLPVSRAGGGWGDAKESFFLATSAVCITGLCPVASLGDTFTDFGLGVILVFVHLGGLGVMTLGTCLISLLGRRMSMEEEKTFLVALGVNRKGGILSLLLKTVGFTLGWELAGAVFFSLWFALRYGMPAVRAAGFGLFHSVMSFCNAGFTIWSGSMAPYLDDPVLLAATSFLALVGSLGFVVLASLSQFRPWRRNRLERGRLGLHTKIVLWATGILWAGGALAFYLFERGGVLAPMSEGTRWTAAFFHSLACRSNGFTVFDGAALGGFSRALDLLLMFIGGASGSMAGGIRVTTVAVLLAAVVSTVRNRDECEIAHRTVPQRAVHEAIAVTVLSLSGLAVLCGGLLAAEHAGLSMDLVYESVSAFGTVGLSTGATPALGGPGAVCVMVCMFIGRLGPVTLAISLSGRGRARSVRYPEENVLVG